eukprot:CAMPEP_0168561276 /NCGR_PEP_ID=MMETSP0413-20121227/11510_1 /TAXON_ID=136452 /ORGANISM="Filamoeba nolandi, Strain NC-AS-23-1" /LENGTH=294 /DNA_ID=CAMNT_0008592639 /DNA_START=11 /DNA_END=892 /DNA_ORIENTATION=-
MSEPSPTTNPESAPPVEQASVPPPYSPQPSPQDAPPQVAPIQPIIQNTPPYPQPYSPTMQPYPQPYPLAYPPNVQPYPAPVQQTPPLQTYYVNTPPATPATPVVPVVTSVTIPVEDVSVPPEPTKTKSYIVNTIIVIVFLIGLTILMTSFQWNPSERKTTETDPYTGESSTEISENTGVTSFASAVIFIVWIGIGIMNLYVVCSGRNCHCPLGLYYGSCCIMPTIIVIFFLFLLLDSPNPDAVWGVRVAFAAVMMIWGCVISCCVYVNRVTESWITTTTTYWSDGSKTKETDRT